MNDRFSIVDIETTGAWRSGHKITEIAIINVDGDEVVESYSTLINPQMQIPSSITHLTGITNQMVHDSPKFYEVAKKIVELTEDRVFVAHNVYFDFNFLKYEFGDLGYSFKRDKLCTVRLARKYLPGHDSYSLGKLCNDLKIPLENRHRALGDAQATVKLFNLIKNNNTISNDDLASSQKLSLPKNLDKDVYEDLPECPGVYYFYNDKNKLLYVGKSKNIKKRVSSHFRLNIKRKKDLELKNSIAHIDYKKTGSELAALLLECQEITTHYPPFNTALKAKQFPIKVTIKTNCEIHELKITTIKDDEDSFLCFKNKTRARRFINKTYRSFLNSDPDSLEFTNARDQFIEKFGLELYNQFLEKNLRRFQPKKKNFELKLPGRHPSEKARLKVENYNPCLLEFYRRGELINSINFESSPQMQRILFHKLYKK